MAYLSHIVACDQLVTCWEKSTKNGTVDLDKTDCEKYLGVYMDDELKFTTHCEKKVNIANKLVGMIRRSFTYLDGPSIKRLFKAIMQPHYVRYVFYIII